MTDYRIFIQARMSSRRLPGKMLAPLAGKPMLAHVIDRIAGAGLRSRIVILTSEDESDTPLALYAAHLEVPVFRGELENVASRFQAALAEYPASWFVRISGDSPLIDGSLVAFMAEQISDDCDIVSNVWRRSFPSGQSVECIRTDAFLSLDTKKLTSDEQQHVTPYLYANPDLYRLKRIVCADPKAAEMRLVVDTLDDYIHMEHLITDQIPQPAYARLARSQA